MAKKIILEVSVENLGGAQAAERGGAQRLELCDDLSAGGITPSEKLMSDVRSAVKLPLFAMIRPRSGGFVYSAAESSEMKRSIAAARKLGMDGIVLGILTGSHDVDVERTRELVQESAPLPVTFHRAFDVSIDLRKSLGDVLQTGATRILSSGGAFDAFKGAATLSLLRVAAHGKIEIVPGTGINPDNIAEVARITGACEIHSGLGSVLGYGTQEFGAFEALVRKMVDALAELSG